MQPASSVTSSSAPLPSTGSTAEDELAELQRGTAALRNSFPTIPSALQAQGADSYAPKPKCQATPTPSLPALPTPAPAAAPIKKE